MQSTITVTSIQYFALVSVQPLIFLYNIDFMDVTHGYIHILCMQLPSI